MSDSVIRHDNVRYLLKQAAFMAICGVTAEGVVLSPCVTQEVEICQIMFVTVLKGGCYFFSVNLLKRNKPLLIGRVDLL